MAVTTQPSGPAGRSQIRMESEHHPIPISRHGHNTLMGFRRTVGLVRIPPQSLAAALTARTSIHRAPARTLR